MRNFFGIRSLTVLAAAFLVLLSVPLHAQTADKLEALFNKQVLSWSDSVVFVLEASDTEVFDDASTAFNFALEHNWLPKNAAIGDLVSLKGLSLLLMRSFDFKGGIFYSLTKSPHYAYRELIYKGIIRGRTDPDMNVSGQELLLLINRLLALKEKESGQEVK